MRKIIIDGFKINDKVQIIGYNPPLKGVVADMYEVESQMIDHGDFIRQKYPKMVPIFEVILEGGKLRSFVKDVVKKDV